MNESFLQREFRYVSCRGHYFAKATGMRLKNMPAKFQSCSCSILSRRMSFDDARQKLSVHKVSLAALLRITCYCYGFYGMPTQSGRVSAACSPPLHWQNEGHLPRSPRHRHGSAHDYDADVHVDTKFVCLMSKALVMSLLTMSFFVI